ncbi:amidase [Streptomyces sp. NPDC051976]|uniref:amidase n=1 Tax=Streptomyces sp. NPDC051976 TaxID=3154947 RepID=UPI003415586D
MTDLFYLSAAEALRLFRARELSPLELMRAVVERAERTEPAVNAFVETMTEHALRAAAAAERRYRPGGDPRPLEGLPVAAKENLPIAGRPLTDGTLLAPSRRAGETAIVLTRIEAAGGILHARTTTSEFCCMPMSHTRRWGVTRNPWNFSAAVGGSSGGSAASLAAGTSMLATGTDIGGSLRAPASFAGVVAFKPPHGRNPILPPEGLDPYQHHGPMARTVGDCMLLQSVMAGEDPRDPASGLPVADLRARGGVHGLRVAFCATPGDFPVDSEVRDATRAAAESLRAAGAVIEEIDIPWRLDEVNRALWAHFGNELATRVLELDRRQPGVVSPYTLAFARKGVDAAHRVDSATGQVLAASIGARLDAIFGRFDALVLPTVGATAFAAGEDYTDTRLTVNGMELDHFADASLTPVFNIHSTHPVVAVPSGWASNGVPTGVQVAAAPYDDGTAFRVALAIEAALGTGFTGDRRPAPAPGSSPA